MVRNIVVLGGSSHPHLTETICDLLGIPPARALLGKFSVGETRVEIQESVRGKDVFIIQSGGGKVNDHLMELLITISACKMASASRITAVLPLFPYSKQSDLPYNKRNSGPNGVSPKKGNTGLDNVPLSPLPSKPIVNGTSDLRKRLSQVRLQHELNGHLEKSKDTDVEEEARGEGEATAIASSKNTTQKSAGSGKNQVHDVPFEPQRGYRQWIAQAGTLVADLLMCAGADHLITMDLHDPQYQGFFDIPVDNLYGRHLLRNYIQFKIPNYQQAVIVSPDAGGAKRATAIADYLGMPFALIHKERRTTQFSERQNPSMMLVGNVANRTAILIDDLADTCATITRAARLVKNEGATKVYALVTHGILSGEAIDRVKASALDKIVVTNTVDQNEHVAKLGSQLDVLDVGRVFAEAIRRVNHGESISVLFQYD